MGLSEKDLKVINLDFNAAVAALAAQQIDASWGGSNLSSLQAKGLAEIPLTTKDLNNAGSVQSVLVGAKARDPDIHVQLQADEGVNYGEVARAMASIERAGITKVSVITAR